jgi:hypothetical protein
MYLDMYQAALTRHKTPKHACLQIVLCIYVCIYMYICICVCICIYNMYMYIYI